MAEGVPYIGGRCGKAIEAWAMGTPRRDGVTCKRRRHSGFWCALGSATIQFDISVHGHTPRSIDCGAFGGRLARGVLQSI
jgi:hypothetical protein